jgi:hypothetical protein
MPLVWNGSFWRLFMIRSASRRRRSRAAEQPDFLALPRMRASVAGMTSGSIAIRPMAFEPHQHRLVGAVAAAGVRQRAEHLGAHARTCTRQHAARSSSQRCAKRQAARIGPTVCEELGPMPILNRSKVLTAMGGFWVLESQDSRLGSRFYGGLWGV